MYARDEVEATEIVLDLGAEGQATKDLTSSAAVWTTGHFLGAGESSLDYRRGTANPRIYHDCI